MLEILSRACAVMVVFADICRKIESESKNCKIHQILRLVSDFCLFFVNKFDIQSKNLSKKHF